MLRAEDVRVVLGKKAVISGASFCAPTGCVTALLGRNGAGKTTLMRGLANLLPIQGSIMLEGTSLGTLSAPMRGRLTGYVAQDRAGVAMRLTVMDLLVLAQNGHTGGLRTDRASIQAAERILESFEISHFANATPSALSGGERQMIALAVALVRAPRLLLLDEPSSALDIANQMRLLARVQHYTRCHGIVTLMIVHDLNLVTRYADRVLLLDCGTISAQGRPEDVLTQERIASVYGVSCHIGAIAGGHRVIYPIDTIEGATSQATWTKKAVPAFPDVPVSLADATCCQVRTTGRRSQPS
jgi:iron complex transport system ATP-binding protein